MKSQRVLLLILFITVAGLLTSCDPVSLPYLTVDQIAINNSSAYIHVNEYYSFGVTGYGIQEDHYFVSNDYGKFWEEIPSPPFEIPIPVELLDNDQFEPPYDVQLTTCNSNNPEICYRIAGKEQVEISYDGGQSWDIDWKMPLGRKKFMERNPKLDHMLRVEPDIIPYDIGIISREDEHFVIVAMGNQGVLVKSPNGTWDRYAVETSPPFPILATPLPFYAKNLRDAIQSLGIEITWSSLATVAFFIVLSNAGRKNTRTNQEMTLSSLSYSFTLFVGIMLVFIFWAFGIIPVYEIALSIAIIIGVLTAIMGVRSILKTRYKFTL